MPELAEVEFYRKQWDAGRGQAVVSVRCARWPRLFRDGDDPETAAKALVGSVFTASFAHGKQMLFRFGRKGSTIGHLGIHLGMTGKLRARQAGSVSAKHDHLVLSMANGCELVFNDPRRFGLIRFAMGEDFPEWWSRLPPPVLSAAFTRRRFEQILARKKKSPLKAVLLDQDGFPGVGNWMADEILWQTRLHPAHPAGDLDELGKRAVYRVVRSVCRGAMRTVGHDYSDPPASWLFRHRWKAGNFCPRCKTPLARVEVASRTTCFCPACQEG